MRNVTYELPKPPQYFGYNARINKFEPFFFESVAKKSHEHLSPERVFELTQKEDVVIIDVRPLAELKNGIIKNSICVAFDGGFANWIGTLLDPKDKLILFGTDEQAEVSIKRLLRIGYINVIGHANFSLQAWKDKNYPIVGTPFYDEVPQPGTTILDVRKPSEWKNTGIADGAVPYTL